jgi:hypothetical protein
MNLFHLGEVFYYTFEILGIQKIIYNHQLREIGAWMDKYAEMVKCGPRANTRFAPTMQVGLFLAQNTRYPM